MTRRSELYQDYHATCKILQRVLPIIADLSTDEDSFVENMKKFRAATMKYARGNERINQMLNGAIDSLADTYENDGFDEAITDMYRVNDEGLRSSLSHLVNHEDFDEEERDYEMANKYLRRAAVAWKNNENDVWVDTSRKFNKYYQEYQKKWESED